MKVIVCFLLFVLSISCKSISQINYNFFISNSGKNSNPGTIISLPKQTIAGSAATLKTVASANGIVNLGLESGSLFNESLNPSYPISAGTYNVQLHANNFAVFNGTDVFDSGWKKSYGTSATFQQAITFLGEKNLEVGNYSYVYVVEINKQLEKTAPFTARRILKFAPSAAAVDTMPGSIFEATSTAEKPISLFIHTSDGTSPNLNSKYRYEVSVRDRAINAYSLNNSRFENLWVRGYSSGDGLLPAGNNSYYNKIIFGPGAAIHHVVTHNGIINNSLFLPGVKNANVFAVVFYDYEGFLRHNKVLNSIFLDVKTPIYTHTNGTDTRYGALELDNVIAFADATEGGTLVGSARTDSVLLNNIYTDKYTSAFNFSSAGYVSIQNSYFKDVTTGITFGLYGTRAALNNVFIRSGGNINDIGVVMQANTSLQLTNSIINIRGNNLSRSEKAGFFIVGSGGTDNHISATGNIFICDIDPSKTITTASTNIIKGIATSADVWSNNVYILLKGNISWQANKNTTSGYTNIETFSDWKRQSGQDQNSLFFDLRNDPRGLQAIFIDPDNGNYELANTVEGNQIRELKAGMLTPITCFLKKPTYEEAAEMIKNGKIMAINSCRFICQQTDVNLMPSINDPDGFFNICRDQDITFNGSGKYKENDVSYHQSDITSKYLWWFSDATDTSGTNLKKVTHKFTTEGKVSARLQIVDVNGCSFDTSFSAIILKTPVVKLGADTTICTGSAVTLSVNYPAARYLWNTGSSNNTITTKEKGIYWVQATANGCSSRDSMELKVQPCGCDIQMPNTFSPNGDGVNEVYKPVFGCLPVRYDLSIYNRRGQLVFKTSDGNTFWDGKLNGRPLPVETYVYILNLKTNDPKNQKPLLGSITLLR